MTDNIPELENIPPEMLIAELAKRTQASLATLNHLLEQNPNLRVADILMPDPNSYEAEVRGVMFDIFHRAAKAMGRNSNEAILADARGLLENMAANNLDMSEIQTSK